MVIHRRPSLVALSFLVKQRGWSVIKMFLPFFRTRKINVQIRDKSKQWTHCGGGNQKLSSIAIA